MLRCERRPASNICVWSVLGDSPPDASGWALGRLARTYQPGACSNAIVVLDGAFLAKDFFG